MSQIFIDMTMENEGTLASSATTERREGAGFQDGVASASVDDGNAYGSLLDCKLEAPYFTLEEFDNYLNSLDELFALPSPGNNASFKRECVMKARQKLSSLLAIGFPSLVLSNKLGELLALTSELQKDPSPSPEELSTLKLIEEIPLNRQRYLKAKEASAEADKFFSDLDSKIVSVTSLKNEYNTAKQDKEVFLAEEASCLLAVLETNEKIAKLQSRRAAMAETIKMTNKRIVQCNYTQQKVMDCLPKIVHEVQVANSSKVEWDLKRKKSAGETAEILAKFAPLAGFSLRTVSDITLYDLLLLGYGGLLDYAIIILCQRT